MDVAAFSLGLIKGLIVGVLGGLVVIALLSALIKDSEESLELPDSNDYYTSGGHDADSIGPTPDWGHEPISRV